MIKIYHNTKTVTRAENAQGKPVSFPKKTSVPKVLQDLAVQFPDAVLVWCNEKGVDEVNVSGIKQLLHHDRMLLTFNPCLTGSPDSVRAGRQASEENHLGNRIGYVEESAFIKVNKTVRYPTWQMSSAVGATTAKVINEVDKRFFKIKNFDYFLNSVAKTYMPLGLFCYSEPKLLINKKTSLRGVSIPRVSGRRGNLIINASNPQLFKFVKQHYKPIWTVLLLLNVLIYEKKLLLWPFLLSLIYGRIRITKPLDLEVESRLKKTEQDSRLRGNSVDVIIPTIGRKQYLYDVLTDLKQQTHLPKSVIIVEQNPDEESVSKLDYLTSESWPFNIKHSFTHQTGACNARNVALSQVESEWVFLNDDDNRFDSDLIEKMLKKLQQYGVLVGTTSYLQAGEKMLLDNDCQVSFFGSGNSFLRSDLLKKVSFDMGFEFGYGEDTDFGMQLRNIGADVIYFSDVHIAHLKAPMGGFRTNFFHPWETDNIQPKPSPTVMLFRLLHHTKQQRLGYKTTLCLKFYKHQNVKNPFTYIRSFRRRWTKSVFWAERLRKKGFDKGG